MQVAEINRGKSTYAGYPAKIPALYAIAGGSLSLIGWASDTERLTDWLNNHISMFPNTAIAAVLCGLTLLLLNHPGKSSQTIVRILAASVAVLGAATLFEHITRVDLRIDTLLYNKSWGQVAADAPMRMGPPASISFLMLGVALFLLTFPGRGRALSAALGVLVVAVATLSLTGFLYGVHQMYMIPHLTGIAMPTASMIFGLGIAVVANAPEREPMRSLFENSAAGLLARRALPVIIVISLTLGWARVGIQNKGLVDTEFGTAMRTVIEIALLTGLLWSAVVMVRRHEQALLHAKHAAESANIAKDNFLATLSHELRTPLTPVLAMISAWEDSADLPLALRHDMQTVRHNIELEARLIDDLLDLTRIVKGKLSLNTEQVNVHRLTSLVVEMYRSELHAKKLDLNLRLEATSYFVQADPGRLQQALWNLLKNAAKFTPPGGQIEITTRNDAQDRLHIAFRDTGIGIAPQDIIRLFKPFEQGSTEVVKRYGGLGLGLAIAKALLTAQQGEITAQSDGSGKGSTFTIILPAIDQPAENPIDAAAVVSRIAETRTFRLLLVEDHDDTARALARLLRNNGHQVELASSVQQAVQAMTGENFDVLVSDIGLPDGTGVDLIRQIRQKYGQRLPALALTGFGMEEDIARCKAAGFTDHLTKPVNLQKLEAAIQRIGRQENLLQ
jgi:signal transduction histidine kinase/ActR/RegA family two-component response regulator